MQAYNELTQTLQWGKSFVGINSKCLGETSCHQYGIVTFDLTIDPMFNFERPFARNGLLTLGEWHQGQSVVDNKKVIFFLHGIFPFFYIFTFQRLSTPLPRFEVLPKKLWWPIPPFSWPCTNHKATPYVIFGAFFFIHLVVIHSNEDLVVEQTLLLKKSLM